MLELRRLRYLVVLAKRLSFSRAAEDLGLSQSALSRAIQSLESELDVRLFDRDRAGVMLTEQGRWIVEKAEALLTSATDFEHQVGFVAKGAEGRTRFGISPVLASALLPALAPRLRDTPGFVHEVMVGEVEAMWLKLALGDIEFMICSEWTSAWPIPEGMPVRIESLGHFPINLIVRKDHPLLSGVDCARGFPLLVSNPASFSSQLLTELRERMASSIQVIEELAALRALVRQTEAIWLTSSYLVIDELFDGIFGQVPLPDHAGPRSFEVFMYSLVRRTKSPPANEIEEAFRSRISQLSITVPDIEGSL
ncbi:MAG: LysR family transcriptional regulator [Novosphingobium sp.]